MPQFLVLIRGDIYPDTGGYAVAIIKRIGPNYNEAKHIKEAQRWFEDMPDREEIWEGMIKECEEDERNLVYIPDDELPEGVPTLAELKAMICGSDKVPEFEKPEAVETRHALSLQTPMPTMLPNGIFQYHKTISSPKLLPFRSMNNSQ